MGGSVSTSEARDKDNSWRQDSTLAGPMLCSCMANPGLLKLLVSLPRLLPRGYTDCSSYFLLAQKMEGSTFQELSHGIGPGALVIPTVNGANDTNPPCWNTLDLHYKSANLFLNV